MKEFENALTQARNNNFPVQLYWYLSDNSTKNNK